MTVQAQFLTKKWEISQEKVMSILDFSYNSGVKTETAKTSGGRDKIVSKGYDADTMSFSYVVNKNAGCDPEKEFSDVKLLTGKIGPFLIGGARFGALKWRLISVKPSDVQCMPTGEILSMKITLNFEEPGISKNSNKSDSKKIGKKATLLEKTKSEKGIKK